MLRGRWLKPRREAESDISPGMSPGNMHRFERVPNPGLRRCEPIRIERIPLLASPQGGVAERLRRFREASADREAGVVFRLKTKGKPPRLRQLRWLREIFLMTQPPLLAVMQGGE